jgi:RHS repeat-associated protein
MSTPEARTGVTAPPSGNGNVPGLGEAFTIDLNTGQGVYSYKLALPDGRAGHGARLALEYANGTTLGPFGLGWKLGLRSIGRRLDFGAAVERWRDGGQELVETPDGFHAAARETAFTRYRRSGDGWLIEERNGVVHECGLTEAGRVADPDHPERVQEWLIERSLDPSGNAVEYAYEHDGGFAYPASVRWAAYELRFSYEPRPDARQDGRAGYLRTLAKRCARIELFIDGDRLIRSWTLAYREDPACGVSLLAAIAMTSHGAAADGSQDVSRPPARFGYSEFDPTAARVRFMEASNGSEPPSLDGADTALVTLDRAPLPGVLQVVNGEQLYWPNRGDGRWGEARPVGETPTVTSFGASGVLFADADGSARADMLVAGDQPVHGYYENGGDEGWTRFVAYPRGHAAAPPWASGQVRLMDVDGDGVVDAIASGTGGFTVWRNGGGDGWSEPAFRPSSNGDGPAGIDFADPLVHLADMNGDGLPDIVRVGSGLVEYWPGLGDGNFGARTVMAGSPELSGLSSDTGSVLLVDVDGDGCADLVRVSGTEIEVAINRSGREFAPPARIAPVPAPIPGTLRASNMSGRAGSGAVWSSLRFGRPAFAQVDFAPGPPPYVLTSIDNGSGLRSELAYRSAVEDYLRDANDGSPWTTDLPFPVSVVASTREVDEVSGQETVVDYSYHDGHFAAGTRQFHGFRRTERVERGDESRPDTLTVCHFLIDQEHAPGNGPEYVELNGRLARTEIFALDGTADEDKPYRVEESDYDLSLLPTAAGAPRERTLVSVTALRVEDFERTADLRGEERTYDYDAVGNVVRETLRGYGTRRGVPQPERAVVTEVEYATAAARHLVDRVARIVQRDGAGTIVREQRRYYDGPDFEGLGLGEVDRGLLAREDHLVLSEAEFAAHYEGTTAAELGYHAGIDVDGTPAVFADRERCAYDARGVKIARRDALGNEEAYEHDPDGLFRTVLRDSLGETRYVIDRAVGQPSAIDSPDGTVTSFEFDAQGRVTATLLPGDDPAAPPRTYAYDDRSLPNARRATFRPAPDQQTAAVTYFDGHGREVQERIEVAPGRVLVSAACLRNPWGEVRREFEPSEATSLAFARPRTRGRRSRAIRYDALGRVVATADYRGGVARSTFRPFEVVLREPGRARTPRREEFDVLRDRTRVVQALGGGATAVTRYDVGPVGELLAVHDDSGTLTTCAYDRTGGRLVADHREGGLRKTFRDARGRVVGSRDPKGNEIRAEIDAKGRLVRLTLDGETVEELTYDDPVRNAHGRLASAIYPGGRQDFTYDAAGRIVRHDYAFDGADRVESLAYEYDGLGRELAVSHTDGRRIERELTPNGWVRAIPGILDEVSYDARGLPTTLRYANGVVTDIDYTRGPGYVRRQRTTGPAGELLHDITYDRDDLGLVVRSDDATPGGAGVREFAYDPLDQLQAVSANGGPPLAYTYDRHYNLAGLGDTGAALHHDDPDRAYRLTGVTANGSLEALAHDTCGNVEHRGARRFTYDYRQALTRFEDGSGLVADYGYDPFGARVSKVVDDGNGLVSRTFFLGEDAEVRDGTPTLFARIGDLRVAVLHPSFTRFAHPDPLGSTAFFTDDAGAKVAAIAYLPFGNVAAGVGDIDQRSFGSHPFDAESGLYYMQRRHYDPTTARFLQPDPIAVLKPEQYLGLPRAFHPYAYVGNDPLNNADPDGLSFWTVMGAIAGVGAAMLFGPIGFVLSLVTVGYMVALNFGGTALGDFGKGFLIGLNAGLNAMLAGAIYGHAMGTFNFLASFDGIAAGDTYQGMLGWSNWVMPMSWTAVTIGAMVFYANVKFALLTANQGPTRINRIHVDWATGSIVMEGGLLTAWPIPAGTAAGYNLGTFVYTNVKAPSVRPGLEAHEIGHGISLAAFGSVFHLVGFVDEVTRANWSNAYAEMLADSNALAPGIPTSAGGVAPSSVPAWAQMWV